ncbi:MAG: drug resistance transporter, EmrB/QacA subfamily [Acidimicrobiia bacterium]|nr:drug resistance transporter, EmrB/QacA subfamily [Acidimicrobiia bacterium]
MVTAVDNTILNVALPSIVRNLGAQGSELQWIIDAYTIVFAGLLLTAGSLGDRLGRKGALTFGLTLFGFFSALASQAGSPLTLIICRGLMGIGGAFIFPTTLSILTNTFTGRERGRAIGIWAGVAGLGVVIGPLGGGLLLEHFWWGSVFLVNVPVCIVAVIAGHFVITTSRDPSEGKLDPLGAALSIVALGALLTGIIEAPDLGWSSPTAIIAIVTGAVFLVLFLKWEAHTDHPMLDVRFFRNPRFSAASATITLVYFALFGSTFLLTQYFQFVLGYSPLKAGAVTAPVAVGIMTFAPLAPRFVERFGTKWVVVTGLSIVAFGLCMYCSDTIMSSAIYGGMVRLVYGIGMGLTTAPATESIMGSLPPGKAGVGSAVNDTTRQTGGALGVAVLGSVFLTRYHSIIGTASQVPAAARDAVKDSIGRALEASRTLPPDQQKAIHALTHHAYVTSMRAAYGMAAATVMVAALVTWRFLPSRPPAGFDDELGSPGQSERDEIADAISVTDA